MKNKLQLEQLSRKISSFSILREVPIPPSGWTKAIRSTLGMSLLQLGKKLGMSKQGVLDLERREKEGSITLNALNHVARALDMQLVYGFVPNDSSLEALIDRRAILIAKQIVMRTSHSMKLEDQEISKDRIQKAIQERATIIKNEMPKILWD